MKKVNELTRIKRVANGKFQAELLDYNVVTGSKNVLADLNEGDEAFTRQNKPRYAYFPVTVQSMAKLGISNSQIEEISELKQGEEFALNISNVSLNGSLLRIQVVERDNMKEGYESDNTLKAAKQLEITPQLATSNSVGSEFDLVNYIGEPGYFMTTGGRHIFTDNIIKAEEDVKHVLIANYEFIPKSELSSFGSTLAEPVSVETTEKAKTKA